MISVDHAPGNPLTVAERPAPVRRFEEVKLVRQLVPGDAIGLDTRGWGTEILRVDLRTYVHEDDNLVRLDLSNPAAQTHYVDFRDGDETVVLYPANQIGTWR